MKNTILGFVAVIIIASLFFVSVFPLSAREKQQMNKGDNATEEMSQEDREIIENMEMLKNLDMFIDGDIDFLNNMEILLADS